MTDRELMQIALDALSMAVEPKKGKVYAFEFQPIDCDAMYLKAIEALRARLAQPEQEPVAQVHVAEDYHPHVIWMEGINAACFDQEYLYITPPQREWQGLTTQEIADETDIATSSNKDIFDLRKAFWCGARWADEKLKEKNAL